MVGQADFVTHSAPLILSTIDRSLSLGALVLVAGVGTWWTAARGQDPLRRAPLRPNQLREDAVLFTILIYVATAIVISGLVQFITGQTEGVVALMAIGNGAQLAGLVACLVVAATRFEGGVRRFVLGAAGSRPVSWLATMALAVTLALGLCPVVSDATVKVLVWAVPGCEFLPHPTISALRDGTQSMGVTVVLVVGAVLVAPLAEELFFRGILQTYLVGLAGNRWTAIGLASAAFGAVHYTQPYAVAALVLLGVLIGYAYERTGALLAPVGIHALFNLKTLIWEALGAAPA